MAWRDTQGCALASRCTTPSSSAMLGASRCLRAAAITSLSASASSVTLSRALAVGDAHERCAQRGGERERREPAARACGSRGANRCWQRRAEAGRRESRGHQTRERHFASAAERRASRVRGERAKWECDRRYGVLRNGRAHGTS